MLPTPTRPRILVLLAVAGCGGSNAAAPEPPAPSDSTAVTEPAAAAPAEAPGCGRATLLARPADQAARGPWPVGARTVRLDGRAVEIWYPARPGSAASAQPATYDLREHLPADQAARVDDDTNAPQPCDCYRDLPVDRGHGPYPLVVFFHGAGSFRTQSAALATHWASRGFVVVAPDLPAINLRTALGDPVPGDPFEAGKQVVRTARDGAGPFADLAEVIDGDRIGLVGHSLGGGIARAARDEAGVQVIAAMASGGVGSSERPISTLIIGGDADGIVPHSRQRSAYADEPAPARLVTVARAGHLAFSDLCLIGRDRGGMLEIAVAAGVEVPPLIRGLATDGCTADNLAPETGLAITRFATTAALAETLQCDEGAGPALRDIRSRFSDVADYREK